MKSVLRLSPTGTTINSKSTATPAPIPTLAKTLHFTLSPEQLHPTIGALVKPPQGKAQYQLDVANALWGQKGYPYLPDFLTLIRKDYGAELHEVDFVGATEEARQTINSWVEEQTHNKISNCVPAGSLKPLTRLVLSNAIYFKGTWVYKFDHRATTAQPFFISAKESRAAPMMHQEGNFRVHWSSDHAVLELPYAGNELSMVLFLPNEVDGLTNLEKALTAATLKRNLGDLKPEKVNVSMPRFHMTRAFALKEALSRLGMPRAFAQDDADFSGINAGKPEPLFLEQVLHKAFVEVNEDGTEAAAASGAVIGAKSAPRMFRADHPFVFVIRDLRTDSILFLGRVVNPLE